MCLQFDSATKDLRSQVLQTKLQRNDSYKSNQTSSCAFLSGVHSTEVENGTGCTLLNLFVVRTPIGEGTRRGLTLGEGRGQDCHVFVESNPKYMLSKMFKVQPAHVENDCLEGTLSPPPSNQS